MLFTRTLRRKLLLGVGLVLGMLAILSSSGILGLRSYRETIRDLEYDLHHAPQQAALEHSIASLFEPLLDMRDERDQAQQELFTQRLTEVGRAINEYRRRTDDLRASQGPGSSGPVTEALLREMEFLWGDLARLLRTLPDPKVHAARLAQMQEVVARMLTGAGQLPDPVHGQQHNLARALAEYRSALAAVWISTGVVVVLFLGLLRYGHKWIFHPMRQLHQGALRVANGDFDYRVRLKTRDEMAELAAAFNQMTTRFQEIAADLDGQVQERSRQLVRSERLAGVGFLAAGVAHEINNPLSAIAMAAESLEDRTAALLSQMEPSEADVVRQYLRMIQTEAFRCRQITERLLDFSRGRDGVCEPTDVAQLVSDVVAMVQHLSKYREKHIEFATPGPCLIEINSAEIKQVVLNLVANGLDAMERGGTLRIALVEQTDHVQLEFRDEGCGMTPEVLENMFEPFFTRKQNGQGTGLGLSISHRIVSQHGGTIRGASSGPGCGSTFFVRLPRRAVAECAAA